MKLLRALVVSAVVVLVTAWPAQAADNLILTDAQISAIRAVCVASQDSLLRLDTADRVAYVNLGRSYDTITRDLMAPFVSRASLNGFDTVALNATMVQFRKEADIFTASYSAYKDSLQRAQNIDCKENPVEFYSRIETARYNRKAVNEQVKMMRGLIDRFRTGVDDMKQVSSGGTNAS